MQGTNRQLLRTLDICWTVKFKAYKRRKQKWLIKLGIDRVIWRTCLTSLYDKVKKTKRKLFSSNSSTLRFKDSREKSKWLRNKYSLTIISLSTSKRKSHPLLTQTMTPKPQGKGWSSLLNNAKSQKVSLKDKEMEANSKTQQNKWMNSYKGKQGGCRRSWRWLRI